MPSLVDYSTALRSGSASETSLTDMVFHWHYPQRGGASINTSEPNAQVYINEWLAIRDNIVRPMRACRGSSAPAPTPTPTSPAPSTPTPTTSGGQARTAAAQTALAELARWNNGATKESNPAIQATLKDYWVTGTGSSSGYNSGSAWSAAFISWVMRRSGAGGSNFAYSGAHGTYVAAARANRYANNSNPFRAYKPSEVALRVGDILVRRYDTSRPTDFDQVSGSGYHGDVITAISNGRVEMVGGNVGDSVTRRSSSVDATGKVVERGEVFVAVVRVHP